MNKNNKAPTTESEGLFVANQEKDVNVRDYGQCKSIGENIPNDPSEFREETSSELIGPVSLKKNPYHPSLHNEETAAEIAAPVSLSHRRKYDDLQGKTADGTEAGTWVGYLALALSIISLFVIPILFGAAGIVLGFIARGRGAGGLGAWAIGIGVVSIVIGIFIIPFF